MMRFSRLGLAPRQWWQSGVPLVMASAIGLMVVAVSAAVVIGVPTPAGAQTPDIDPDIDIEKFTNGLDADTAGAAVEVAIGDAVTWTYVVTNTGLLPLADVTVVDDQVVPADIDCGGGVNVVAGPLAPGARATCTANGAASLGSYTNIGQATGQPVNFDGEPVGDLVADTDPSNYVGLADPAINIEKITNDRDADLAPGPQIPVGNPVTWIYLVTNTGDVALANVTVVDDDPFVAVDCGGGVNSLSVPLAPGSTIECSATGTAWSGQYTNIGSVVGTPSDPAGTPLGGSDVSDTDPSHYFGSDLGLDIEKTTNGWDADAPAGAPVILTGDPVVWGYVVINEGNVILTDVNVTDSDTSAVVNCGPGTGNVIVSLAPGEAVTCTASGTAIDGLYNNIGFVAGNAPSGESVSDEDPSHYFGADPGLALKNFVNDDDAQDGSPLPLAEGSAVTWLYEVTNTGNTNLIDLTVADDQGVVVDCGGGSPQVASLAPGASVACLATGIAIAGAFRNEGVVVGTPADDAGNPLVIYGAPLDEVTAADEANYFGELPAPNGSIGGLVWFDADSSGSFDAGESGIIFVEVALIAPDGSSSITQTDAAGNYLFTDLPLGDYTVTVNPATLPSGIVQTYDGHGLLDNESITSLTEAARSDLNQDFGYGNERTYSSVTTVGVSCGLTGCAGVEEVALGDIAGGSASAKASSHGAPPEGGIDLRVATLLTALVGAALFFRPRLRN